METSDSKLVSVAELYLKIIGAKVSATSIRKSLLENPYYPSLYSLTAVCKRFDLPSQAFKVPIRDFDQLEAPFLAYYNSSGNDFVLVTSITDSSVELSADGHRKITISKQEFLSNYREIVFVAEPNEKTGEEDYVLKISREKKTARKRILTIAASVFVVILFFVTSFYAASALSQINLMGLVLLSLVKLLGGGATLLLLAYEVDQSNEIVKSICSAGKQNGCDAVLNSKASKFLGMSWSEIGFYYFSSTTLFLLYPGTLPIAKTLWLCVGAVVAAPYILFSLYYQWIKLKQWCALCLTVQSALFLEFVWSLVNFLTFDWVTLGTQWISTSLVLTIVLCASLPIVCWSWLKPMLRKTKNAPEFEAAYKRLLYSPEIFGASMQQQEATDGWQNIGILIGNPTAPNTIVKVCNPYCGPCAKTHPLLEEIITHNQNYNLRIIFTATNNDHDTRTPVVKHLLAVAEKGDADQTAKAVDDWYRAPEKDYPKFAAQYPMNGELKRQADKIEAMNSWCQEVGIKFTPTIMINGRRLPDTYSVQELKHIL